MIDTSLVPANEIWYAWEVVKQLSGLLPTLMASLISKKHTMKRIVNYLCM